MDEPRPDLPWPPDRIDLGDGAFVRLYVPGDAPMIFEAVDRERERLGPWLPWVEATNGPTDTQAFIEATIGTQGREFAYGIFAADGFAGGIGLHTDRENRSAMIGYWIATYAAGRGIGKQAIRDALSWARRHTDIRLVWAIVAEPNVMSRRVLEANGFQVARKTAESHTGDPQLIYELALGAEPDVPDLAKTISVTRATPSDDALLANLLELYIHDLSGVFTQLDIGSDGRFGYRRLPLYWSDPDHRLAFLIRASERVVGFALVERRRSDTARPRYDVSEFFVLRRYRRRGVGQRAAALLWKQLPGQWTVRVAEDNGKALAFWRPVIESFAKGDVAEHTSVQDARDWRVFAFESPASNSDAMDV